jgi:hypothetical protein
LYPPSVAGWPSGKNWIDSSSLLLRMRLPQLVALSEPFDMTLRQDDDINMGKASNASGQPVPGRFRLRGDVDWESLVKAFEPALAADRSVTVPRSLLQSRQLPAIAARQGSDPRQALIELALQAMATPEYQLC